MPQTYKQMSDATKSKFLITKKKWYEKNRLKHQEYKLKLRIRNDKFIEDYKLSAGCKVCGFKEHPEALDLHHRDASKKEFSLSRGSNSTYSLETLQTEINKCDVLCANHHRIHHALHRHPKHQGGQ